MRTASAHAAAVVYRRKVVVVASVAEATSWMETGTHEKYSCRLIFIDFTQFPQLQQSGNPYSTKLSKGPDKVLQEELGRNIQTLPMTPVTGSLLVRAAGHALDTFNALITRPRRRQRKSHQRML